MLSYDIPGRGTVDIEHLVLDYNGTVAVDGSITDGVASILNRLADKIEIHVITADTFGHAAANLEGIKCRLKIISDGSQDKAKELYLLSLGAGHSAAIGNGRNDALMLEKAAVGIAVIMNEGAWAGLVAKADIVCRDIVDALLLFENPLRLKATLRL